MHTRITYFNAFYQASEILRILSTRRDPASAKATTIFIIVYTKLKLERLIDSLTNIETANPVFFYPFFIWYHFNLRCVLQPQPDNLSVDSMATPSVQDDSVTWRREEGFEAIAVINPSISSDSTTAGAMVGESSPNHSDIGENSNSAVNVITELIQESKEEYEEQSITRPGVEQAPYHRSNNGNHNNHVGNVQSRNGDDISYMSMSLSSSVLSHSQSSSTYNSAATSMSYSQNSPRRSARKMLTDFIASDPSNRCCADCQCVLLDFTKMYCSFYDIRANLDEHADICSKAEVDAFVKERAVHSITQMDFAERHARFKPPSPLKGGDENNNLSPTSSMIRTKLLQRTSIMYRDAISSIAHAVFICSNCSAAHRALGSAITTVKSITIDPWSHNEVYTIRQAGGNARSNLILEAFLKRDQHLFRPGGGNSEDKETRLVFTRAKYQTLAFLLPCGPLNLSQPLLSQGRRGHSSHGGRGSGNSIHEHAEEELPNRLMDFFCIIASNGKLEKESHSQLSTCRSPSELCFQTEVTDCYPSQHSYGKRGFPSHLPKFVYPQGCRPSTNQKPTFFTFTLTNQNGTKIYGAALHIYDFHLDMDKILGYVRQSGYEGVLPSWLEAYDKSQMEGKRNKSKASTLAGQDSDLLFLPKCLVILSHYGFFDVMRKFLLQLYHISMVKAPLPLERYIANFVSEVPLPPQGKLSVRVAFANNEIVSISRPPINRLPLVNFSYRPLFTCLSVSNIMVVMGFLLQESRVAVFSKHASLLGPSCEALCSLLFPLVWQGIYIPVLPESMTVDLLEAPIPFLVGAHRVYLDEFSVDKRPKGVTLVDLDNDVVHMGFDEGGDRRLPPFLPEKDASKLKLQLEKSANGEYMVSSSNKKGVLTYGRYASIPNEERPMYCRTTFAVPISKDKRSRRLAQSEFAFQEDEHLMPIEFSGGMLTEGTDNTVFNMKGMKTKKKRSNVSLETNASFQEEKHLLDIELPNDSFNGSEIRNGFLRFMVALLQNYDTHILHNPGLNEELPTFLKDKFLSSCSADAKYFLSSLLDSQMFERFIFSKVYEPDDSSLSFFDDSITAKKNRSKMSVGRRKETKFISDQKYNVVETFTPPEPSSQGISDSVFRHLSFPIKLNSSLFGTIRKCDLNGAKKVGRSSKVPGSSTLKNTLALKQQLMNDLLQQFTEPSNDNVPMRKDANWALHAITFQLSTESDGGYETPLSFDTLETARTILDDTRRYQMRNIVKIMKFQKFWISQRFFSRYQSNPEGNHNNQIRSRWMRPAAMKSHWSSLKTGITIIQSIYRSRRVRRMYQSTLRLISTLQSVIRGYQTRKKVSQLILRRTSEYRQQIPLLWERANISLIYRSRFVLLQNITMYLAHAFLEKELRDLYEKLGIIYRSASDDESSFLAKTSFHGTFLAVQSQLNGALPEKAMFPSELNKNSEPALQILQASFRIELERVSLQ